MTGSAKVRRGAKENALYWVDRINRRLNRFGPGASPWTEWRLARMPGCFAFRRDGTMLLASRNALSLFDPATGADLPVPTAPVDFARERFNDGAVDRAGRFWVGSMERMQSRPEGRLFCVEPDLSIGKVDDGITVANGICWNPDGCTTDAESGFWVAEPGNGGVHRYDPDGKRERSLALPASKPAS